MIQDIYSLGIMETGAESSLAARLARLVEAQVITSVDAVSAIHDHFKTTLVDDFKVPERKVAVIRNWTHITPSQISEADRGSLRAEMGWGAGETVVLHTGAMGAKQALETVVDAAALADAEGAAIKFVLVGDGSQREILEGRAHGLNCICFMDPVDEQRYVSLLAAADVLLLNERPTLRGMAVPSKLTSYFASGRPVLAATDPASASAIEIQRSGAGVLVEPGDPRSVGSRAPVGPRPLGGEDGAQRVEVCT